LQHETQKARQYEHVDEDVGAESEKRVPVPGCPQRGTFHLGRDRRHEAPLSINGSTRLFRRARFSKIAKRSRTSHSRKRGGSRRSGNGTSGFIAAASEVE